jgi:hypothetical protein
MSELLGWLRVGSVTIIYPSQMDFPSPCGPIAPDRGVAHPHHSACDACLARLALEPDWGASPRTGGY